MLLDPLTPADIPEVMRLERLPGYDAYVGRWTAQEHQAEMASPEARYLGVRKGDGLEGFIILQAFDAPQVRLRRIVVESPGEGLGGRMLREVTAWVFGNTAAEAFWLDVHVDNARAKRAYEREGFGAADMSDEIHLKMVTPRERWMGRA